MTEFNTTAQLIDQGDTGVNLGGATIAVQKAGRLTLDSLLWLNTNAGTDFPVTDTPFADGRTDQLRDTATGITIYGQSNGDLIKAGACMPAIDAMIAGEDQFYKYEPLGGDDDPYQITIAKRLGFGGCQLVFARPDTATGPVRMVATSYPRQARAYLTSRCIDDATVAYYSGGIESKARQLGCDMVEITASGQSLAANGAQIIEPIASYQACLLVPVKKTDSSTFDRRNRQDVYLQSYAVGGGDDN